MGNQLVNLKQVHEILSKILEHPGDYLLSQCETDMGSAVTQGQRGQQVYNKISLSVIYLDASKIDEVGERVG